VGELEITVENRSTLQKEFLEIISAVRTHVELQRALGVSALPDVHPDLSPSRTDSVLRDAPAMSLQQPAAPDQNRGLNVLASELQDCTRCKLSKGRKNIVVGEGRGDAVLMFVGDAPGQDEDGQGKPFVGAVRQLLLDIIVKGMQIDPADVYICSIVKCSPPYNRAPEPDEIEACEHHLVQQIEAVKPEIIVALGKTVAQTLLKTKEGITALRGTWQSYRGIPVMPTYHPAHLVRKPSDKKFVWGDIQKVMALMNKTGKTG
jgi:DNA polymerase